MNELSSNFFDHRLRGGYTGEHNGHSGNMPKWMRHINTCQPVREEARKPSYNDCTRGFRDDEAFRK